MAHFTFADKIACVEREIAMRKRVYRAWVGNGKMKLDDAEYQIACMEAVLADIKLLADKVGTG